MSIFTQEIHAKAIFNLESKSDGTNYRPMSVVSVFLRRLETKVHNQFYEHLKATKALTINQSVFHKCCSTITSLIDSTDIWYDNIKDKQQSSKSFDTVNHAILKGKLRNHGIQDIAVDCIQSYLENRNSTVPQITSIRGLEL